MSSNYTVILDANVMYPAPLRSFLMYLALSGEFRARWTDMIHDEWVRNLLADRPDINPGYLQRTRELMNSYVPGSIVTGFEPLIEVVDLPDPKDRHVVAAAIKTRAESIITFNLKDFPEEAISQYDIEAVHPDDFIASLMDLNIGAVIEAARRHRAELKNPPLTASDYLDKLLKQKLPQTVSRLRDFELMI